MERKYFSKYESGNTSEKHEFIGKKRNEGNDYSYSRDRNQNYYKHGNLDIF
jgi:hypothetical protein